MNNQEEILPVPISQNAKDIVAGCFNSIAITSEGIWIWGKADLCNSEVQSKQEIIQIPQFLQILVDSACAGSQHSFAWRNNEVYCWGSNKDYKLGLQQPKHYELTKSQIFTQAIEAGMELNQIACGDSHSLAVFKLEQQDQISYQIFAWGESKNYQLALDTEGVVSEPIMIEFGQSIKHLYSRNDYSFVVTLEGDCYSWGTNLFGRLGFSNSIKNQKFPSQIQILNKISSIAMGKYHCMAISEQNEAYSWGHGLHGQLGLNQIMSEITPTKIQFDEPIVQAACGEYHSIIITKKGQLYSCGTNAYFGLGHNEIDVKKRCKKFTKIIKFAQNIKVKKVVCGNRHNLLLSQSGKIYSWGCNKNGQLGRVVEQKTQANYIKRQLYKDTQKPGKAFKQISLYESKSAVPSSPFSEIKESFSPQNRDKTEQKIGTNQKLLDWKRRYEIFKFEQQRKQKQYMKELQQILKQTK